MDIEVFMKYTIRELRDFTGLSQSAFAKRYGIPLSTLCKWEQRETSPAPYFIELLASNIPGTDKTLEKHKFGDKIYYYNRLTGMISDQLGNWIKVDNIDGVIESNLGIYLEMLFEDFYRIQNKFNENCYKGETSQICQRQKCC